MHTSGRPVLLACLTLVFTSACGSERMVAADAAGAESDAGTPEAGAADAGADAGQKFDSTVHVNPFIGTDGNGMWGIGSTLPGPMAPFGMVKAGPDTVSLNPPMPSNYTHCAGYYYRDEYITGFSQNHFSGTGVPDYGNLGLMPRLGRDTTKLTSLDYKSLYMKESEAAEPGYYTVTLADGIKVEVTATDRAAFHRYTFPKEHSGERCVLIDLGHTIPVTFTPDTRLSMSDDAGFGGYLQGFGGLTAEFGGYRLYFKGEVSPPPASFGAWDADLVFKDGARACGGGTTCGAMLCWPDAETAEVKVALSYVSAPKARANFNDEADGISFDEARAATREKWRGVMARFKVADGAKDDLAVFYTAVYHLFGMPTLMSDVDGGFLGFDDAPHVADWGRYYSDFSLWDTYRTQHPLLTLVYRGHQREMVHSLLAQARTGGYFPKWSAANGETNCMVGTSADIVIADSYLKGIDFPAEEAFDFAIKSALHATPASSGFDGRPGIEDYLQYGYLPVERNDRSVSVTQEYAVADNALCAMATKLGRPEADSLCATRYNHRNLWNEKRKFFLGRSADGTFPDEAAFTADTADRFKDAYVEGNAWQYRWFAPHDAPQMIEWFGGSEAFARELASFFEKSQAEEAGLVRGTEEWGSARRYYWQGNEPDLHTAYLFSAAGRPDLTCTWIRWAMRANFINSPDGMPGNDDAGTESAWYIFSALGFYPIPGSDLYYVGCPLFKEASVTLDTGTLKVTTEGPFDTVKGYPATITWNGTVLAKPELTWDQIKDGGELRFTFVGIDGN